MANLDAPDIVSRSAVAVLILAAIAMLAGCGDPVTDVQVDNTDGVPYIVTFRQGTEADGRHDAILPARGKGGIYYDIGPIPKEIELTVELRTSDCVVVDTVRVEGEHDSLITVAAERLTVKKDADLTALPFVTLDRASKCAGG